ncbi:MAG: hypothetical protein F4100_03300 [Rhodothermaceae bacterium]|nr:hypothetical protein [Rhodothermaceae bacterium]MYE63218.1 hypothetical protein [Rhodothermaceae bacterium]MYJ19763.1 hypothetical protein [Rhodothermaceae bacterium]
MTDFIYGLAGNEVSPSTTGAIFVSKGGQEVLRMIKEAYKQVFLACGLLLFLLPMVAFGQEQEIQIKAEVEDSPLIGFDLDTGRQDASGLVIVLSDELNRPLDSGSVDVGGVDLFRVPDRSIHDFDPFTTNALIGPVWDLGISNLVWDQKEGETKYSGGREILGITGAKANNVEISVTILEGNSRTFPVSLELSPSSEITVTISGYEGKGLEVEPKTLTFTTDNWDIPKTVKLTAAEDDNNTNEPAIRLTLTNSGGVETKPSYVNVMIVDDEIEWELAPRKVREGFPISISIPLSNTQVPLLDALAPPSDDVTFTLSGHQGQDIIPVQTRLRFPLNNWMQDQILNLETRLDEGYGDEDVRLTLTASGGGYDGLKYTVVITIVDRPREEWVLEGESITREYILYITNPENFSPLALSITLTGFQDTDLNVSPQRMNFSANSWYECDADPLDLDTYCLDFVPITMLAMDDIDAADDFIVIEFIVSSDGPFKFPNNQLHVRIEDDDDPSLIITPSEITVREEGKEETFEVKLSAPPLDGFGNNVSVTISFLVGRDMTADLKTDPTTLIFTADNWDNDQKVKVQARHDNDSEDEHETILLEASGGGFDLERGRVHVTIIDDDRPGIKALERITVREGDIQPFDVSLEARPSGDVRVSISGYDPLKLEPKPAILIFKAANWDDPEAVTLHAYQDTDIKDEEITLTLKASGGGYFEEIHHVIVIIEDDDRPEIIAPMDVTVNEGSSRTFNVSLRHEPSGKVTVRLSEFSNTDLNWDLTEDKDALMFTPSNYRVPQIVTVYAKSDDDAEPDRGELLLTATGGDYDEASHTVSVTVQENDTKGIVLDPSSLSLEEEGQSGTYDVWLQSKPVENVRVRVSLDPVWANLILSRTLLNFTVEDWNVPQTVTVEADKDNNFIDETVTLVHTPSGGGYDGGEEASLDVFVKDKGENPLTISIYDAQVNEQDGEVDLPVLLSRAAKETVSVLYQTVAQSAESGSDYISSRGIMFFDPGATNGKIRIEILDDEFPEVEETFAVVLSSPRNAEIMQATGQVTVLDNDSAAIIWIDDEMGVETERLVQFTVHLLQPSALPISVNFRTENGTAIAGEDYHAKAGTLTFAPGMMEQEIVVELLSGGLDSPEETFTVRLEKSSEIHLEKAVGVATIREDASVGTEGMKAYTTRFVRTSTLEIVDALQQRFRSRSVGSSCLAGQRAELVQVWGTGADWNPSLGELLAGCHVSQEQLAARGVFRVWGRGAFTRFNGRGEDALNVRGDVTTAMMGTDYRWGRGWTAGVLVSHSQGHGSFELNAENAEAQSWLTGMVPYVSMKGADWDAWLAVGYGLGQTEVEDMKGDLVATFGAGGVQGEWASNSLLGITVHGDILVVGSEVDEYTISMQVYRFRAGLGADLRVNARIRPYVEVNVRQDGGSAETGTGLELGGGVQLSYPSWRLKGELRTHGLVMHTVNEFTEWGMSGVIQMGGGPEGLMVSVRPSWGPNNSGVLQHQQTIMDAIPARMNLRRTDIEMAYGMPLKSGVIRPLLGMTQLSTGGTYLVGTELRPWDQVSVSIFGLAHTHTDSQGEIGLNVQGSVRY